MKGRNKSLKEWMRRCLPVVVLLPALTIISPSLSASIYTLTDNGVTALFDSTGGAGWYNWTVAGQNQLNQQWFWYRIGTSGGESAINAIGAPTITQNVPYQLTALYANGALSVQVTYGLTGNTASSGMNESVRIINNTATNLDLHFFQYTDFDLGGFAGGQTVSLGTLPSMATQTLGSAYSAGETVTPTVSHREANFFNNTLVSLNDLTPTTLNDNLGPVGPGDVTFAFQWDFTIGPGLSKSLSPIMNVQVPEPSALALMIVGLAALTLRRQGVREN
jgi:hypothetical protein